MYAGDKYIFISPVLIFGSLYGKRTFEQDMAACLEIEDRCDGIILCSGGKDSDGCLEEYKFAMDSDHLTITTLQDFLSIN